MLSRFICGTGWFSCGNAFSHLIYFTQKVLNIKRLYLNCTYFYIVDDRQIRSQDKQDLVLRRYSKYA